MIGFFEYGSYSRSLGALEKCLICVIDARAPKDITLMFYFINFGEMLVYNRYWADPRTNGHEGFHLDSCERMAFVMSKTPRYGLNPRFATIRLLRCFNFNRAKTERYEISLDRLHLSLLITCLLKAYVSNIFKAKAIIPTINCCYFQPLKT